MSKRIILSLAAILTISVAQADDTLAVAKNFDEIFTKGKVSGQIDLMYSGHEIKNNEDPYSTAIGGQLKYETAQMYGFTAGAEFTTVHEIDGLSGDTPAKRAELMVSANGSYTQLSQAYLNYGYEGLNLRLGRQMLITPLADNDHYRIIDNTFEAAIATYDIADVSLMLGYINRWQGTDTGLDNDQAWQDTGKDGTYFSGISYTSDLLDTSAWYYDISEASAGNTATGNVANKSIYLDATLHLSFSESFTLDTSVQYLNQSQSDNSGIDADIYGLLLDATVYKNLELQLDYNRRNANDDKTSFSGFGGGTLNTSSDNMILDAIVGGDVDTMLASISYAISDLSLYYTYAVYQRDETTTLVKEDIHEQSIGANYSVNDNLSLSTIVTINDNKEDTTSNAIYTGGDFTNIRVFLEYTF